MTIGNPNGISKNMIVPQLRSDTPTKLPEITSFKKQTFIKSAAPLIKSTFAKRHPPVLDRGELPSFIIEGPAQKLSQQKVKLRPPPYYFEPERIAPPLVPVTPFEGRTTKESELLFNKKAETLKRRKHSYF